MGFKDGAMTPDEAARLDFCCAELLTRDDVAVSVSDEDVYAYVSRTATFEQRVSVEEALLKSKEFCEELLEISGYLGELQLKLEDVRSARERRAPTPATKPAARRFFRRPRFALVGAAALVAMLIGAFYLITTLKTPREAAARRHLVVLPLECAWDDAGNESFCAGLAETVTGKLARLERYHRSFWVVPTRDVTRKRVSDPVEAGRVFGATLALTGTLRRLAGEFNLELDLIDVAVSPPRRLASTAVAGPLTNLSALQTVVTQKIAGMLGLDLPLDARGALSAGDTDDSEANRYYLEGRGYLQRYENPENLENAIGSFERAIEQDSMYALARAGLGEAYWRKFRGLKDTQWVRQAAVECRRALELDSTLAPIHVTMGNVRNEMGEYESAISHFETALALDSTAAGAYNGLADSYARLGRLESAESTYELAISVKPDYWGGYNDLGYFYYTNGRFDEAAEQYAKVAGLTPDNYLAFSNLGAMYYYLERWDEAKEAFARSIKVRPNDRAYLNLASIYYIEGNYGEAAELCERALELNENNYKTWATLANSYYWTPGRRSEATAAYRRAIELAEQRLELNPRDARILVTLAGYYVMVNEGERATTYIDRALQISADKPFVLYFAGYVYEQLGQRDKALEYIGKALNLGYPLDEIERDPWLSDFRDDDRFKRLLLERE
ncbi:MAG: tetratricopeptide repeat protein [Candidatus Latescibacterota bacterium]|jgi:tetratricopeptide (TPR) repeat protein